ERLRLEKERRQRDAIAIKLKEEEDEFLLAFWEQELDCIWVSDLEEQRLLDTRSGKKKYKFLPHIPGLVRDIGRRGVELVWMVLRPFTGLMHSACTTALNV